MEDWLKECYGMPLRDAIKKVVKDVKADDGSMSSMAEHTWDQIWAKRLKTLLQITI